MVCYWGKKQRKTKSVNYYVRHENNVRRRPEYPEIRHRSIVLKTIENVRSTRTDSRIRHRDVGKTSRATVKSPTVRRTILRGERKSARTACPLRRGFTVFRFRRAAATFYENDCTLGPFARDTHVCSTRLLGRLRSLGAVGHLLRVRAASPASGGSATVTAGREVGTAGAAVRVVSVDVVLVVRHHLVGDGLLVVFAEHLLEDDDQGQDESDLTEQQGLSGDQGEFSEDEREDGHQFEFQQGEQLHHLVLGVLLLCKSQTARR